MWYTTTILCHHLSSLVLVVRLLNKTGSALSSARKHDRNISMLVSTQALGKVVQVNILQPVISPQGDCFGLDVGKKASSLRTALAQDKHSVQLACFVPLARPAISG